MSVSTTSNQFIKPQDLLQVLVGFNPWWTSGKVPDLQAFKRTAYYAASLMVGHPQLRRATILAGPRRTGKTTVLFQIAHEHLTKKRPAREILYVSMDHPIVKLAGLEEVLRIYHAEVLSKGKPALLLIDEIQYTDDWITRVKLLMHSNPEYRILATGSAALQQESDSKESGAGRLVTIPVAPLSFYEFKQLVGGDLPDPTFIKPSDLFDRKPIDLRTVAEEHAALQPLFMRYLLIGGFPETAQLPEDELGLAQRLLREDVVERVLKRDMTSMFGIRNVMDLERLFIYLCLNSGGILAVNTVASALGSGAVKDHLLALEKSHLVHRLQPIDLTGKQALKAKYKYYLADAALRNAVLLRGREVLNEPIELGLLVEGAVLRHLKAFHYRDQPSIGYWRDATTAKEVDVVIRGAGYHFAIECKYRDTAELETKGGLVTYCKKTSVDKAFLVTRRNDDLHTVKLQDVKTPFLRIPAHIFSYLLGMAERQHWNA
jgi:predicted AAA+ superfamily ATPase